MTKRLTEIFSVRLPVETIARLEELAVKKKVSVGELVRDGIAKLFVVEDMIGSWEAKRLDQDNVLSLSEPSGPVRFTHGEELRHG